MFHTHQIDLYSVELLENKIEGSRAMVICKSAMSASISSYHLVSFRQSNGVPSTVDQSARLYHRYRASLTMSLYPLGSSNWQPVDSDLPQITCYSLHKTVNVLQHTLPFILLSKLLQCLTSWIHVYIADIFFVAVQFRCMKVTCETCDVFASNSHSVKAR